MTRYPIEKTTIHPSHRTQPQPIERTPNRERGQEIRSGDREVKDAARLEHSRCFFGLWKGLYLSMFGLAVGSLIAISASRLLGERLVRKFVPQPVLSKFDYLMTEGGITNFFMIFLLPALPDDAICFIAGLTRGP